LVQPATYEARIADLVDDDIILPPTDSLLVDVAYVGEGDAERPNYTLVHDAIHAMLEDGGIWYFVVLCRGMVKIKGVRV